LKKYKNENYSERLKNVIQVYQNNSSDSQKHTFKNKSTFFRIFNPQPGGGENSKKLKNF